MVWRDKSMAVTTPCKSERMSVMPAASMATSVPPPMARPMSACARAGASLMPSPTMATTRPSACSSFTLLALSCGSTSAKKRLMPTCSATLAAVCWLSPVIITTSMPWSCNALMAAWLDSRTVSATPISAATCPPMAA